MSIKKRNLLCVRKIETMEENELLLYYPYKNILENLVNLMTDIYAKDFDPVFCAYYGLDIVPDNKKEEYKASLEVNSYFHHSQAGRATFIEKKLASLNEFTCHDLNLKDLPLFVSYPEIYSKKKLGVSRLSREEKRSLSSVNIDWIGGKNDNVTFDVSSVFLLENEKKKLTTIEVKNRVDSGGIAARREVWTSKKMGQIYDLLTGKKILYEVPRTLVEENRKLTLHQLLTKFNFKELDMNLGILFNLNGSPATPEGDKQNGWYGGSEEGYRFMLEKVKDLGLTIIKDDETNLVLSFKLDEEFTVSLRGIYGDDITEILLGHHFPVDELIEDQFDDLWLGLIIAVAERTKLLKYNKNCTNILLDILKDDTEISNHFDILVQNELEESLLKDFVKILLERYDGLFENKLISRIDEDEIEKKSYLADLVQIYATSI